MKHEELRAVEMTRRIRDQMYAETEDLEAGEFLRYFKERSKPAARRVEVRDESRVQEGSHTTPR